jgi:endogenous inhibitor of DNA gyrase (YacG/DUF329 family)
MASYPCPICGRPVDPEHSPAMPFCSVRCRQIDLGRWLDERYSLSPEPEEEPPREESAGGQDATDDPA